MKKQDPILFIFISSLILGAGFLMATVHVVMHGPEYLAAFFTRVDHPIHPDYTEYNLLLKDVVKGEKVDYKAAKTNPHLTAALAKLASTSCDEFPTEGDKLLYWINAYNLLVLKTVTDRFPVAGYQAVTNEMSSRRFTVGGKAMTIKDLRQFKIQPKLKGTTNGDTTDCRMVMLLTGGAIGFPSLCDHAITPETLTHDLEDNTYRFLSHKRNFYFDKDTTTILVSPFFQWNGTCFHQSFDEPFDFAIHYSPDRKKIDTTDFHLKRTYNTQFDWRVNDIATED